MNKLATFDIMRITGTVITLFFIVFKLSGIVQWSWGIVLSPTLFLIALALFLTSILHLILWLWPEEHG
jgi:hypothetical protein